MRGREPNSTRCSKSACPSLKAHDVTLAAIERVGHGIQDATAITDERLEAFTPTTRERLETGDVEARRPCRTP